MYNVNLENQLISVDIVNLMQDYVSIQIDIDETKVKAASMVAQKVDLKRTLNKTNLDRIKDPQNEADEELRELVIPAWCYFTYARCLKMFQGTFTDSGYSTESEADERNAAKSVGLEMASIGNTYMLDVIDFLENEDSNTDAVVENLTPSIRVFGGKEHRASN